MGENMLNDLEVIGDAPVSPATAIAGLALNFAMKWHDMTLIKDGAMYQQKKLEGANIEVIDFQSVLDTAAKLEAWLIGASDRISGIVVQMLADESDEDGEQPA